VRASFCLLEASDGLTVQSRNEPDGYGFRTLTGDGEPEVGEHFPVFALNFVLATPGERWALRYPDTDELWVLERQAGGARGCRHLDQTSQYGTLRVRATDPPACESAVLATERMDEHPIWRLLEPGELLRVPRMLEWLFDHPGRRGAGPPADTRAAGHADRRVADRGAQPGAGGSARLITSPARSAR
jgi:hypothetical protein